MDSRLEIGGERSFGERVISSRRGEPLLELGGVKREPPRRTWQVGQILTKREINSLGTLDNSQYGRSIQKPQLYGFGMYC